MIDAEHIPVIIACGECADRTDRLESTLEPLALMEQALRQALERNASDEEIKRLGARHDLLPPAVLKRDRVQYGAVNPEDHGQQQPGNRRRDQEFNQDKPGPGFLKIFHGSLIS